MSFNDNFRPYGLINTPEREMQFSHTRWGASVQNSPRTTRPYVHKIVHYKSVHPPYHEFIVACFWYPFDSDWRGAVKLERFVRLGQEGEGADRIGSKTVRVLSPKCFAVGFPAEDLVTVCKPGTIYDPPTLPSPTEAVIISTLSMPNIQISDVQLSILLRILHTEQPCYDALKSQCYWYAAAIYDAVRALCSGSTVKGPYFHLGGKHAGPHNLFSWLAFLSVNESSIKIKLPTNAVLGKYEQQCARFQREQAERLRLEEAHRQASFEMQENPEHVEWERLGEENRIRQLLPDIPEVTAA